jgi:hypothetical protein
MKRMCLLLGGLAALVWCYPAALLPAADTKDDQGTVVDLGSLKSRTPATWKAEEPSNRMRFAQFRLPKVKDDKYDAEVVIFQDIGGSAKDNIERWKTQFIPPEGKKIDDVAKVMDVSVGDGKVTVLDITGTYKYKERPFDPNAKEERRPEYHMVGVIFGAPNNKDYQIRFVGPVATVEHYKPGFDEWLKNFK